MNSVFRFCSRAVGTAAATATAAAAAAFTLQLHCCVLLHLFIIFSPQRKTAAVAAAAAGRREYSSSSLAKRSKARALFLAQGAGNLAAVPFSPAHQIAGENSVLVIFLNERHQNGKVQKERERRPRCQLYRACTPAAEEQCQRKGEIIGEKEEELKVQPGSSSSSRQHCHWHSGGQSVKTVKSSKSKEVVVKSTSCVENEQKRELENWQGQGQIVSFCWWWWWW